MKYIFHLMILLLLGVPLPSAAGSPPYAKATLPTPVFNTPDISGIFGGTDGRTVVGDTCGQLRTLEFVALPGTPFRIDETIQQGTKTVYRVRTEDYPYPTKTGYFIDSRFVTATEVTPPPRVRRLPPRGTVLANLVAAQGSRYVWGSNVKKGIPEMLSFFPPGTPYTLPDATLRRWQLRGVDCSGLLYEATGGFTPRNTSALVEYGKAVPVAGLGTKEIIRRMEPLDLIVWKGHVMIVLDRNRIIESRLDCTGGKGGVVVSPLPAALDHLLKTRLPLDDPKLLDGDNAKGFVVRRWYGAAGE